MLLTEISLFTHVYAHNSFCFMFHMYQLHPFINNAIQLKCGKYNKHSYCIVLVILFNSKTSLFHQCVYVQVNTTSIMFIDVNIYIIFI